MYSAENIDSVVMLTKKRKPTCACGRRLLPLVVSGLVLAVLMVALILVLVGVGGKEVAAQDLKQRKGLKKDP